MKYWIEFYKDKPRADVYTEHVDGLDETAIEAIDKKWLVGRLDRQIELTKMALDQPSRNEFDNTLIKNRKAAYEEVLRWLK